MTAKLLFSEPTPHICTEHPEKCPERFNKGIKYQGNADALTCSLTLGQAVRTGLPESEGRYKRLCPKHGYIYYNLIKIKSTA